MIGDQFAGDKRRNENNGEDQERRDPPGRIPVLFLTLIELDLERADADGEHAHAPIVDPRRYAPNVGRIEDKQRRHDDGRDADGDIDVEDPAPTVGVGEPAAEDWTDDGGHEYT